MGTKRLKGTISLFFWVSLVMEIVHPSFRALWWMGNAAVGRENAEWTTCQRMDVPAFVDTGLAGLPQKRLEDDFC